MLDVVFDPQIIQALPTMRLGLLEATDVTNRAHDPALWMMVRELEEHMRHVWGAKGAGSHPQIAATRHAYRAVHDDPARYRPANEALLRRALTHRALPQINAVVDINTYVSLHSGFAVGCYNLHAVHAPVTLRCGQPNETYTPIGKPSVDAAHRVVLADQHGIFGSPTVDSARSMVTIDTRDVVFVIFAFDSDDASVERALDHTAGLLQRFCSATVAGRKVAAAAHAQHVPIDVAP